MINQVDRNIILKFFRENKICIVSTVNLEGKPEAATIAFSETDHLELIFQTPNTTRKYQNLKKNPFVAITIGFDLDEFISVQYEGIAKEVTHDEIDTCRKIHSAKNPISATYAYVPENKYFKVTPNWIKYSDLKTSPPQIITINF